MTSEDAVMMGAVRFIKEKLHAEFEERMKVLEKDKQELLKVRAENARLREALQEIACFNDAVELRYLDEHFSAKVAREALSDLRKGGE